MNNLKELKQEINLFYSGDQWGWAMSWGFALCDILTERGICPEYWEFRQSPFGSETEALEYQTLKEYDNETLLSLSGILNRYINKLKAQGKDY